MRLENMDSTYSLSLSFSLPFSFSLCSPLLTHPLSLSHTSLLPSLSLSRSYFLSARCGIFQPSTASRRLSVTGVRFGLLSYTTQRRAPRTEMLTVRQEECITVYVYVCYRNDTAWNHENNWVRGECRYGTILWGCRERWEMYAQFLRGASSQCIA